MRSALIPNVAAETSTRDAQEAQDEAARQYWANRARFGWTPYYFNCPLDAIEDVARGLRPAICVRFLLARHVIEVGRDEWALDGDLELWRRARAYAEELNHQGFLKVINRQGELVYQMKAASHTHERLAARLKERSLYHE
jgi:hypothetical protein